MNYEPLSQRIIGKRKKKTDKQTAAGIIIPQDINDNPYIEVEVLAVGRGYVSQSGNIVPMETKVGDIVLLINTTPFILPKDKSPEIAENEELVIFQESDIYTRIKD